MPSSNAFSALKINALAERKKDKLFIVDNPYTTNDFYMFDFTCCNGFNQLFKGAVLALDFGGEIRHAIVEHRAQNYFVLASITPKRRNKRKYKKLPFKNSKTPIKAFIVGSALLKKE